MVQSIQLPPDHPDFAAVLNKRLAEIAAELDQLRGTKGTAQTESAAAGSVRSGSHQQRLSIAPSSVPLGTTFYETDRTVTYIVTGVATNPNERRWTYLAGAMRGTISPDQKPADLNNAGDAGFLFYSTDYARTYRWTGTAWENAPGEIPQRAWCFFEADPGVGWSLANGAAAIYSTPAGGISGRTKPYLLGLYMKGAAAYTGTSIAATNPTLTGETADESGHTHTVAIPGQFTSGPTAGAVVQSGAGGGVASDAHTHYVAAQAVGTGAGSAHKHGKGTLAVTGGEPAHVDALPYVRL